MASMFIRVEVDPKAAADREPAAARMNRSGGRVSALPPERLPFADR